MKYQELTERAEEKKLLLKIVRTLLAESEKDRPLDDVRVAFLEGGQPEELEEAWQNYESVKNLAHLVDIALKNEGAIPTHFLVRENDEVVAIPLPERIISRVKEEMERREKFIEKQIRDLEGQLDRLLSSRDSSES